MKRRTIHPAHRPLRLERCEARRMLSATAPNDPAFTETQALLPTFVPWVQQSGWTPIDGDSSIVSVDYSAYRAELGQDFFGTTFTTTVGAVDDSGQYFVDTDFSGSLLDAGPLFQAGTIVRLSAFDQALGRNVGFVGIAYGTDSQPSFSYYDNISQAWPSFNFGLNGDSITELIASNFLRSQGFPMLGLPASKLGAASESVFSNDFRGSGASLEFENGSGFTVSHGYGLEEPAPTVSNRDQSSEPASNRHQPSWDLGAILIVAPSGSTAQPSSQVPPAFGSLPSSVMPSDFDLGALDLTDDPTESPLLEPTDDSGPNLSEFSGPNESTSAEPLLPLPTSDSPIERARPSAVELERVSFVSKSAPDARAIDAGMIDLAEVLFAPQHAAPVEPLAIEPDAPSLAARDAALAVESWVRTLPAPTDLPTAAASVAPGPDAAPIEARTLPERPATEKLLPPRDRVSTAASKAATPGDAPASQPWEERLAQPYGFLAISLTLVGGSVWASRRTGENAGKNCIERPRRGPRTLD